MKCLECPVDVFPFLTGRTGCLLGLALALAALCRTEQAELHARVAQTLDKMLSALQDGRQGRMFQEVNSTTWMDVLKDGGIWMEG